MNIPTDYIEFLHWVKERTEHYWAGAEPDIELIVPEDQKYLEKYPAYTDCLKCEDWMAGATWQPLTDAQIKEVEEKYHVQFTWHHREFLKILHTLDKYEPIEIESEDETQESTFHERAYFYNWLNDDEAIKEALNWSYEVLKERISWLPSWGERPDDEAKRHAIFDEWYDNAPTLTPIFSHRFVVSEPADMPTVLSIASTDTIIYGHDMRDYLLNEIGCFNLGLGQLYFDSEWKAWHATTLDIFPERKNNASTAEKMPAFHEVIDYFGA